MTLPPPLTKAETAVIFENEQAAVAAAVGVYHQIISSSLSLSNGGATIYPALSADELYNTAPTPDYDGFLNCNVLTTTTGLNRLWVMGYKNIYHCNAIMEGLVTSHSLPDFTTKQLKGEMLVTRALQYFIMLNCFGNLPWVNSTSYELNQSLPRIATATIYENLINDLLEAKSILKDAYPSAGRARPNKYTAMALLARLYLYTGQWSLAEQEATAIIASGLYSLQTNLNNIFLAGSNEAIWQVSPVSSTINTAEGNTFIPSSATTRPAFAITPQLIAAFETNDQRKTNWLKTVTITNVQYSYPYKYKVRTGAPPYTEMYTVLRLAEIYLIRAEARTRNNNSSAGIADINTIRQRAGLAVLPNTLSQVDALVAIEKERRIELAFEWGHRWFDLKRIGNAVNTLAHLKGTSFAPTDLLYPLPMYDIETNPFLIQNPGY